MWNLGEWELGDGLAHCWALRNQALVLDIRVWGLSCFFVPPLPLAPVDLVSVGLVGGLFVI